MFSCKDSVETESIELPLQFVVPASQELSPRRIVGDPGFAENLELPHWAYIFVVLKYNNDGVVTEKVRWQAVNLYTGGKTDADVWQKATTLDDIVYYNKVVFVEPIPGTPNISTLETCHVYAAMSKSRLALSCNNNSPETEEDVKNVTFTVRNELQGELQDIYSTPYNYYEDGKYYGDVKMQFVADKFYANKSLMLYHVASKVDLKWNVPDDKQTQLRITEIRTKNLFNNDQAYLFRPTENVHAEFTAADGYTPAAALVSNSEGTWWAGRTYFYTIPYNTPSEGIFPVHADVKMLNVIENNEYTDNLRMEIKNPDVFVPWVRGQLNFSTVLTGDNSETLTVE